MNYESNPTFFKFACISGLIVFFTLYGLLQERIMTKPYGDEPNVDYFTFSGFLVLSNRLFAGCYGLAMANIKKETIMNIAPLYTYFMVAVSNAIATFCQYEALKFVSFPTQTLGKTGKMIPVLILGTFMLNKKYTWKHYVVAVGITLGCSAFLLTGETKSPRAGQEDSLAGVVLMLAYLFFDGFTSTLQEKMFKGYDMPTSNQMIYVNFFSAIFSFGGLVFSGQLWDSISFATRHPGLFQDSISLSLCVTLGQQIIYTTIKTFGALLFSTVMTTRQFISIILSAIIFMHSLTTAQWLSALFISGCLYYEAFSKDNHHHKKPQPVDVELGKIEHSDKKQDN